MFPVNVLLACLSHFDNASHVYCDILSRFSHHYGLLISQDLMT